MQSQTPSLSMNETSYGKKEERMLRIHVVGTDNLTEVFPAPVVLTVPDHLKHLELENFGISDVLTFTPHDHLELSKSQRLFLRRLQDVVLSRLDPSNRLELYVQDLVDTVIKECKLDDGGVELYVRFSRLSLRVGSERYTIFSDKECKRSGEIVWILQQSKQRIDNRYKQGDIQMIIAMIAACQDNFAKNHGSLQRKVLFGIKVVGEEFFFYSINFDEEYLQQIAEKLPSLGLIACKYPSTSGLRISKQDERKKLLCLLHKVRECCLSNAHF